MRNINEEIDEIKKRNARVELDKQWETCWLRRLCICILTYFVVVLYSYTINNFSSVWLSSFVPVLGFTLSNLSLKLIRRFWEKYFNRRD